MDDEQAWRYTANHATVADNADPRKLGRVRVTIPGRIELSAWAFPVGTAGGGSAQHGGWVTPRKGADVVVWLVGADPEFLIYMPGWWGEPDEGSEVPGGAEDVSAEETPDVHRFEAGRLLVTIDERAGKESIEFRDKVSDDSVTWNLHDGMLLIEMTAGILLKTLGTINLDGTNVQIKERHVASLPKAI